MNTHRKLLKLYNDPGHAHFITFSCFNRRPYLSHELTRTWLADSIASACRKHEYDLWAYVFMPEHVHLLVKPRPEQYSIGKFLYAIKLPVTYHAARHPHSNETTDEPIAQIVREVQSTKTFWQNGAGYDRNLWLTQDIIEKIDYIHNNPVKRGLIEEHNNWEWSSLSDYMGAPNGKIPVTPVGSI